MTTSPPIYVLDANVFIESHKKHYGFGICPGFWDFLAHGNKNGCIVSIDRVKDEISPGDALHEWVTNTAPSALFVTTTAETVVSKFSAMMTWVQLNRQFQDEAKAEFARVADGWVAAFAASMPGSIVVTHEEYNPDIKRAVKLPNVCKQFGVPWVNTFSMLRALNVKFQWERLARSEVDLERPT